MAGNIVLLGDSIFDNGAYVHGAPDVVHQLREELPDGWSATLLAVDGAVTSDVERQLRALPKQPYLLVVSAGGNDALGESHLLDQPASTVGEGIAVLAEAQALFGERYNIMLDAVLQAGVPTAVCTIYDANFPPPEGRVVTTALSLFNDVITRAAFKRGLAVIDLRLICSEPADYANPIEPSEQGGAKIAAAIARFAASTDRSGYSVVVAGSSI